MASNAIRIAIRTDATDAIEGFKDTEKAAGDTGQGIIAKLGNAGKVAGKALGAAVGTGALAATAALGKGLIDNLNIDQGTANLRAQLGLSAPGAAKAGEVAGQVYRDNFAESLEEVNVALRAVGTNLADVGATGAPALKAITEQAIGLSSTMGVDVAESTKAVSKLIKSGLVPDASAGFDVITKGFQLGLDSSGDFLDTISEYSPHFKKLGIDGPAALAFIQAGLKGGARDADGVADAFKEFGIRAIDGSTSVAAGFKDIGLNAQASAKAIAAGGPGAEAMTLKVIQSLAAVKDPIKQNAAGVALFGTTWEDTVRTTLPSLAQVKGGVTGVTGSVDTLNTVTGETGAAKIETYKRSFSGFFQQLTDNKGAAGDVAAGIAAFGPGAVSALSSLGLAGIAVRDLGLATKITGAATKVWAGIQAAFNVVMGLNPIVFVIIAIVALVAAIIIAYKHSETFRRIVDGALRGVAAAFKWLWDGAKAVFGWLVDHWKLILVVITGPIGLVVFLITKHWSQIKAVTFGAFNAVRNFLAGIWQWIVEKFRAGIAGVLAIFGGIMAAVQKVVDFRNSVVGYLQGLARDFLSMGKNIMQGLIDGITTGFDWVRDKLAGLGGLIPDWLKGALGIHSPSTVMISVGKFTMQGFNQGMESQLPNIRKTLGRVAAAVSDPLAGKNMVKWGQVTAAQWNQLLRQGWKGRAGDRMEALYRPAAVKDPLAGKNMVKLGQVSQATWDRLLKQGWRGRAGDRMEALYRPASIAAPAKPAAVHITVHVPPTADKAAIGREITAALKAYQRQTGKVILASTA